MVLILLQSLLWSCNDSEANSLNTWVDQEGISNGEVYAIDDFGISILWTAYKFSDRIGVSGTFGDYVVYKENESGSIEKILSKLKLIIPTEYVESGNAIRDFKLRAYFFEVFNTSSITGTVLNAKDGKGIISLKMNDISIDTPFTYVLKDGKIVIFTHINLESWKGEKALTRLSEEYHKIHEEADAISRLWPDLDVVIKLPVIKNQLELKYR